MASGYRLGSAIGEGDFGKEAAVAGWVEDVRNLGGIAFLILRQRDGTLQLAFRKKEDEALFRRATAIPRESVIAARGVVKPNPQARNGWEIFPEAIDVLSEAATPLPLGVVDKVGAEFDTRLDNRVLDLRKPEVRAIFRVRDAFLRGVRRHLREEGFLEVHTPKLAGAGAEGGATLFETDYFGRRAFLSQSPQLYKQMLMATGLDRVYEIAPAFRAEPSDTVRHLTEFVSFDGEMAFVADQEEVLRTLETAIGAGVEAVLERAADVFEDREVRLTPPDLPLPRLTYREVVDLLAREGKELPEEADLDTEAEKVLGRLMAERGHEWYFVVEYPTAIKPFYVMAKDDSPAVCHSFDLEYRGDEMASGGQREHRYDRLVARLKAQGLDPEAFAFYLNAFRYGMPPHGGWGAGVDRLVQKMLSLPNVREAVLFPRDRQRLVP
jgi:aspartyl-tRNA synthetase